MSKQKEKRTLDVIQKEYNQVAFEIGHHKGQLMANNLERIQKERALGHLEDRMSSLIEEGSALKSYQDNKAKRSETETTTETTEVKENVETSSSNQAVNG
jgi:SAM-dependent MidA family methyltransferase